MAGGSLQTMQVPTLETPRLWLRPLALEDAPATQVLFPQWEVVRFLASVVPWPYPADGAERFFRESALPAMARGQEMHWSLRLKTGPEQHIGAIRVSLTDQRKHRGFWLGLPWQGRGLMTEAVVAVNDFWFEVLKRPVLRTSKAIANVESCRISEKTGMRVVATLEKDYVAGRLPSELWEITAEEWRGVRVRFAPHGADAT